MTIKCNKFCILCLLLPLFVLQCNVSFLEAQFFPDPLSLFGPPVDHRLKEPTNLIRDQAVESASELRSKLLNNLNRYSNTAQSAGRTKFHDDRLEPLTLGGNNELEEDLLEESATTKATSTVPPNVVPNLFGNIFKKAPSFNTPANPLAPPPLMFPTLPPPPAFSPLPPITILSLLDTTTTTPSSPPPPSIVGGQKQDIIKNMFANSLFQPPPQMQTTISTTTTTTTTTTTPTQRTASSRHRQMWQRLRHTEEIVDSHSKSYYLLGNTPVFLNRTGGSPSTQKRKEEEDDQDASNLAKAIANQRRRLYKLMQKDKSDNFTSRKESKPTSRKVEEESPFPPPSNQPSQQKTVLSPELLKKLASQSRNGSLLLLMLNNEGKIAQENVNDEGEDALTRTTLTPPPSSKKALQTPKLFGVGSSFSNAAAQFIPIPIELAVHGQDQQGTIGGGLQPIFLADSNWLNGLSLSHSPAIQLLYARQQQQQSHSLNTPASIAANSNPALATLAPPVLPPHLLPTPPPYTPPTLLSEFAPTTPAGGASSTRQPEAYVKDLSDLGEDYDSVGATTTGRTRGDSVEEEYEDQQTEPCGSSATTCASSPALAASTWLGNARDQEENTEMCNSRRLSVLIREAIIQGDAEGSKRVIQARAEAELSGFYNVICGTGFYSYIAHTDEFCLASAKDINCYVFSPVCSLRLGFASGIARTNARRMAAANGMILNRQRRGRNGSGVNKLITRRLSRYRNYYSAKRRKAYLNRN